MNANVIKIAGLATGLLGAALLAGCGSSSRSGPQLGTIGTGNNPHVFVQIDRLSRPAINEVFATVASPAAGSPGGTPGSAIGRHAQNHTYASPTDDAGPNGLQSDIQTFMTGTAGRSQKITDVVKAVIVPDVMKVDLTQQGGAAYLGLETGGATSATGSTFGGRDLRDDVIKTSLGIIFGKTIPALNLAPDDGKEIPSLADDNVPYDKHATNTFPYVGAPN